MWTFVAAAIRLQSLPARHGHPQPRACNPKRQPIPFTAVDGVARLRVPLAHNRGEAIIEADDMHAVATCGVSEECSVERVGRGQHVSYHSGIGNMAHAGATLGATPKFSHANSYIPCGLQHII